MRNTFLWNADGCSNSKTLMLNHGNTHSTESETKRKNVPEPSSSVCPFARLPFGTPFEIEDADLELVLVERCRTAFVRAYDYTTANKSVLGK